MSEILDFDDSFILKKHKETLISMVQERIGKNPDYECYDNTMIEVLSLDLYGKIVNGIDKEKYFREIEEEQEENTNLFKKPDINHLKVYKPPID
tara:strand:- start:336 stop:617 length:282 start_codon:yes stop_codon:yes gene_type:complete